MDGKCYLCRKHFYDRNGQCPGCGTYEPGHRPRPKSDIKPILVQKADGYGYEFADTEAVSEKKSEPTGYHLRKIEKGVLGEASKITEEYEEFLDAKDQKNPVMELVELSDMLGAIEAYTKRKYGITLDSLTRMTRATQRAFRNGHRK